MPEDPYESPWAARFNAPKTPPIIRPGVADQYLRSLKEGAQPLPHQPTPPPDKSALEKLADATRAVRQTIADGKLNRGLQVQWVERVRIALRPVYGKQSPLSATLDQWRKDMAKDALPTEEFLSHVAEVDHLIRSLNAPTGSNSFVGASQRSLWPVTKNVFVIHGHDELNLLRLSKLINDHFKLTPIVLLDKPGRSSATIDKFEQHAQECSYAVALFTKDDRVVPENGDEYWQPRPNVIFETGWFVGRLGRERVLILLQDGVQIYSDFAGVNRIQFHSNVEDGFGKIQTELEAAGLI